MLFQFIFAWYQNAALYYFPTFAIKFLSWPSKQAALVSSLLMGSGGVMRLASIPLSTFLSPGTLLYFALFSTNLGYMLLFFVNTRVGDYLMWIGTVFIGIGISLIFPTMCLWISGYIPMTGSIGSKLYIGSGSGGLISPLILGYLFQSYTPIIIVYVGIGSSLLGAAVFIVLNLCIYFHLKD